MAWINVHNDDLERFFYSDYGMEKPADVTQNGKANVPDGVAEQLYEHPTGDFSPSEAPANDDEDNE